MLNKLECREWINLGNLLNLRLENDETYEYKGYDAVNIVIQRSIITISILAYTPHDISYKKYTFTRLNEYEYDIKLIHHEYSYEMAFSKRFFTTNAVSFINLLHLLFTCTDILSILKKIYNIYDL